MSIEATKDSPSQRFADNKIEPDFWKKKRPEQFSKTE
jgi:hypothetical protein